MKTTDLQFLPDMARAWAENRKCRTQMVIKPQPDKDVSRIILTGDLWFDCHDDPFNRYDSVRGKCRYGQPGDRLRLLTTWAVHEGFDPLKPSELMWRDVGWTYETWTEFDSTPKPDWCGKKRSGRFMPGWMREEMPQPKILEIRARRIQDITEQECIEEGVIPSIVGPSLEHLKYRAGFQTRWESINGEKYPWESNPWVFDVRFQSKEEYDEDRLLSDG